MRLALEIRVPDGLTLRAEVASVQAQDATGRFGLLPGHQAFLTLLAPCILAFREESGRERYAAVDGGVMLLEEDLVSVVTREAAVADRLEEVADAAAAMLEARRRKERAARTEFGELQTALLRELRKAEVKPS